MRYRELLAINRAIAGAADQQEILRLVVDRTAAFTGASACLLLLAQGDGLARVVRSTGLDPARVAGLAIPLNERIVEELGRQLDIPATDTFTGVPVVGREGLVGVLAVYVVAGRPDHRVVDTELLSALADQAAIALEGAERTRAIRESEQRLASMAAYVPGMLYTYVLYRMGPTASSTWGRGAATSWRSTSGPSWRTRATSGTGYIPVTSSACTRRTSRPTAREGSSAPSSVW